MIYQKNKLRFKQLANQKVKRFYIIVNVNESKKTKNKIISVGKV